jgi:hypothetical protein
MIYITELAHGLEEYVMDLLLGRVARGIGMMLTS